MTPATDEPGDAASVFADALRSGAEHGLPEPAPDINTWKAVSRDTALAR